MIHTKNNVFITCDPKRDAFDLEIDFDSLNVDKALGVNAGVLLALGRFGSVL